MEDKQFIKLLKRDDERALEIIIKKYTGYVSAVIENQLGGLSAQETIEELASDVFLALWQNRLKLSTYHLRGWLGATARNRARSFLRTAGLFYESYDDNYILLLDDTSFSALERHEQSDVIENALGLMEIADREILIRYYYYNQNVMQISKEMKMNVETVKSKLRRGRMKLKSILEQGGFFSENRY